MKKVATNLSSFLNESSKSIVLKRKYGERAPVSVSPMAPLRNKVLAYVAENVKVSRGDLRIFIAGLNEGKAKPAATSMWLKRNSQYFVTESREGQVFYKLSDLGKRIVSKLTPAGTEETNIVTEGKGGCGCNKPGGTTRLVNEGYFDNCECHCETENDDDDDFIDDDEEMNVRGRMSDDEDLDNEESNQRRFDFIDTKRGMARPGIYDMNDADECMECTDNMDNEMDETMKAVIRKIREKRAEKINEVLGDEHEESETPAEEVAEHNAVAVVSFDPECTCDKEELVDKLASIGLVGHINDEGEIEIHEIKQEVEDKEDAATEVEGNEETQDVSDNVNTEEVEESTDETTNTEEVDEAAEKDKEEKSDDEPKDEDSDEEKSDDEPKDEDSDEDTEEVEIQGFIITVENKEEALKELKEREIKAEEIEGEENQIKVDAEDWAKLKEWLEEKGVNVEEVLDGEVEEVEDEDKNKEDKGDEEDIDMSNIDFSSEEEKSEENDDEEVEESTEGTEETSDEVHQ